MQCIHHCFIAWNTQLCRRVRFFVATTRDELTGSTFIRRSYVVLRPDTSRDGQTSAAEDSTAQWNCPASIWGVRCRCNDFTLTAVRCFSVRPRRHSRCGRWCSLSVACPRDCCVCLTGDGTPVSSGSSSSSVRETRSLRPPWCSCVGCAPDVLPRPEWTQRRPYTVRSCSRALRTPSTVSCVAPRPSTNSGHGSDRGAARSPPLAPWPPSIEK